jgi:hypothetical protein
MNLPDQTQLLASLEAARAEAATLTTARDAALSRATDAEARIQTLVTDRDAALARVTREEAATAEARRANQALQEAATKAASDKAAAEAQLTDFNARVAAEVRRLGLAKAPAPVDPGVADLPKKTATERVLAAKGVRSLAELGQPRA